ncbi:phosphatase PAP2 family protein [Pasteurella dagmatis]|uniref:undecaprenyl-diphosphate phosphatase n=1 Tax=Pasteurella dagmatis ATCC 43325 TaxID=667128 RepID=C9PRH3_9PAST|nr:phosphatase PAP2 family protein [Pasteurella dagmatis]EEX50074.1 PAP2 family protein [Pasteurella dagmatis ATCC 43325]
MVTNMLKRLSLYTLLLCIVPFFAWIFAWQWNANDVMTNFDYALYFLTESGSVPYAIITCGVLALCFYPFFLDKKLWVKAVMVMAFSVILTQGIKSVLKNIFTEPRPYVTYVAEQTQTSTESFYQRDREQRSLFLQHFFQTQSTIPSWLKYHYEKEVGYSFPSGHTIFAAGWLFLVVGFTQLLGLRSMSSKILIAVVTIWSVLMLFSRLRFGMHYPIDLFVSVLLSFVVHILIFHFLQKKTIFINNCTSKCG